MSGERRRSNSFVLRVWREEDARPHEWRGWVQHAITGETCYFHRLADLLTFVETHTGPLAQTPDESKEEMMRSEE